MNIFVQDFNCAICAGTVPIPKALEITAEKCWNSIEPQHFDALKQALARLPG